MSKPVKRTSSHVKRPEPWTATLSIETPDDVSSLSHSYAQCLAFNLGGLLALRFNMNLHKAMDHVDASLEHGFTHLCTDSPEVVESRVLRARDDLNAAQKRGEIPPRETVKLSW